MDRSRLSISLGVLLMVHNNSIGPTSGYCLLHINLCEHHHHFSTTKNEIKIVDLHLWTIVGSRFHPQIGHWLVKGCCEFYGSVSQKNTH